MMERNDPCLDRLSDAYFGEIFADIPNLARVRAHQNRLCDYIAWCLRNGLWEDTEKPSYRPSLRVITNDGPARRNRRRMSSPMKTDEIREFESRVSRVFGIRASAMMEWSATAALAGSGGTLEEPDDLRHRLGVEATITP